MTYQVELHKKVEKFLDTQSDNFVESFFEKASLIAQNPQDLSILDIKPLQWEEKWFYRLRIGKYRFKYKIIHDKILIYFYDAGSRWDIY